ncbi:ILCR1 Ig-like domain-containing protein [Caenorhabditis elegans]|uniref:SEFIR domain-containing protein n=1 Tax=Caenorhabditis elegans TaxID=6239 RepID=Q20477_CAEEL|nr:SEFIR domain-containing protein [Caenorhabditis elegans]CAA90543.2 SEFIR domain-containing protein [Caenorhabditis elegans]|eukprot:NP_510218.2 Uncharacterized protein CELE_F46G10.2 [Caenorhabditis elegans]
MNGSKKYNTSGHSTTTVFISHSMLAVLTTVLFLAPATGADTVCSFNGNGTCSVNTDTDGIIEILNENNSTVNWKIRPQNIGFMYYVTTSGDGDDLIVKGIVKWKVQLKNWSTNDTVVEGFLVTIMDHDTNETVTTYQLTLSEPFEHFAERNDVMEMRLELDDVLSFDKRYDAKINILPIGKQAAASSFLSIMGKLEGEKCSAMTGLAERWAPHVMVELYETTSDIQLSWKAAPQFLCVKTYEVILQNRDGRIINTSEVKVNLGQKIANATFHGIERNQMVQVKVRGKNAIDGGCACVNCNCITDKTKFFVIPSLAKVTPPAPTSPTAVHHETLILSPLQIFFIFTGVVSLLLLLAFGWLCCNKYRKTIFKQKIAFSALKSSQYPNRKTKPKKAFKVMLVCPEVSGRDEDFMMRIADALKKSNNKVVCDRWFEDSKNAEENMLHWVYEQTKIAEKIIVFHSAYYHPRCGIYDVINNFFPCTDPRLAHIALTPEAQRSVPKEVEYVLPRDQKLLEDAFDITIADPLVIDIPIEDVAIPENVPIHHESCDSIDSRNNSKTHSTDSGVSSLSSNSSHSGGDNETLTSGMPTHLRDLNIEAHPLLRQPVEVV